MKKTPLAYARELHAALVAAEDGERAPVIRRFLAGLSRTRKTNIRSRIVAAFSELALASEGRRAGVIVTARPLDAALRVQVARQFKNVIFEERTDPSLLGGAVVEVEDVRIDGSVRSQLDSLKSVIARTN